MSNQRMDLFFYSYFSQELGPSQSHSPRSSLKMLVLLHSRSPQAGSLMQAHPTHVYAPSLPMDRVGIPAFRGRGIALNCSYRAPIQQASDKSITSLIPSFTLVGNIIQRDDRNNNKPSKKQNMNMWKQSVSVHCA